MLDVNEYFEGKVKSIAFQTADLPATVGVMAVGNYTFDTSQRETMTVVSGCLRVQLPGNENWQTFNAGDHFVVAAGAAFNLEVAIETAYLCTYG
ncbi:MAG: pyrimidine/purine nucleoside phosphorylase [Pseudomonadales bacterium]|nr:pyrimidine/purine nucleoside phosphorylase [Pseudomonadales bacterium]